MGRIGFQASCHHFDEISFMSVVSGETGVSQASGQRDEGAFPEFVEIHDVSSGPGRHIVPGDFFPKFAVLSPERFIRRQ